MIMAKSVMSVFLMFVAVLSWHYGHTYPPFSWQDSTLEFACVVSSGASLALWLSAAKDSK